MRWDEVGRGGMRRDELGQGVVGHEVGRAHRFVWIFVLPKITSTEGFHIFSTPSVSYSFMLNILNLFEKWGCHSDL